MKMIQKQCGLTLIELIVVMLIIGILSAVAIPSYRQYAIRSHRSDAKDALLSLATAQEKFYLQCNTYATDIADVSNCATGEVAFPSTSKNGWYTLSVQNATATDFTVRAVPVDGGPQATDSKCPQFEVTGGGVRTATHEECWD